MSAICRLSINSGYLLSVDDRIISNYNTAMNNKLDPETLKIPAYMRKKMIVSQTRQKLILTALDRKQAKLPPNSTVAVAPFKRRAISKTPRSAGRTFPAPSYPQAPEIRAATQDPLFESEKSFPQIGRITHYLDKINVAIIMLNAPLKTGELVMIEGEGELFVQEVEEMQIDRSPVAKAKIGSHIGLKVRCGAKVDGAVYRLS
jgi:hypothetical protein